jgi:hypothetical protein
MSTVTGFKSNGGTPFAYLQDSNNASVALGLDAAGSDVFKISVSTSAGVIPTTSPQFLIDPAANGNMTLTPNGSGKVVVSYMGAGVVQSSSAGLLTSSNGTNGQVLIGGGAAPAWASITAGSGITLTPGANSLTIAASGGGGGITTLDGNSGSATGATVTIKTAHTNVVFSGAGAILTQDFLGDGNGNLALGSALPSLTSGQLNMAAGPAALDAVTSGAQNTAFGFHALNSLTTGTANTGIGQGALSSVTTSNENTCVGSRAGIALDASFNTIIGYNSGSSITTGISNTIVGHDSASSLIDGLDNIILGVDTGHNYVGTESFNILIGASGVAAENRTLRIGDGTGTGTKELQAAFISGIDGVDLSTATLVTESGNQLGTTVLTAGTNITITPGVGTLTLDAGGGITTIDGNSGSATGPTVTITTGAANANGTALFTAAGSTVTQTFSDANNNTGLGLNCLATIGTGANGTALGWNAGPTATGDGLCLMGSQAGNSLTTGDHNTILGSAGMFSLVSGTWNVSVGSSTCQNYGAAESSNIILNARTTPVANENNTLRIGDGTGAGTRQLAQSFISGIQGVGVVGTAVLVSASDQLGVAVSSARFKQDMQPMASDSNPIYKLRPVTFAWNKQSSPGLKDAPSDRQFGLIAEEVVQTMPYLVNNDKDGKPISVHYERLIPMLLNEIQRLEKRVTTLETKAK